MASQAGVSGLKDRADWKHMFSIFVLTGGTWVVFATGGGTNVGVKHQIPYLARPYGPSHFHRSWSMLRHLLGVYA